LVREATLSTHTTLKGSNATSLLLHVLLMLLQVTPEPEGVQQP
jgi:hypothetical protein